MRKYFLIILILMMASCSLEKIIIDGKKMIKKVYNDDGARYIIKRGVKILIDKADNK